MQAIEIVIIVLSVLFVVGIIAWVYIRKKQGKYTCGCGECDGNCAKCKQAAQKRIHTNHQKKVND